MSVSPVVAVMQRRSLRGSVSGMGAALLVFTPLLAINLILVPSFVSSGQLTPTIGTLAPFAIAGMASTPAFLAGGGGIDLSIAPLMGLVDILVASKLLGTVLGTPIIAIPLMLLLGAAVGAVNGTLVAKLRYPPVIATLGMYFILSAIDLELVPQPVTASAPWTNALSGSMGPVPGGLVTIGVPLLLWAALRRTAFVETLLSVGDHDAMAFSAGVNVERVRISAYTLGGLLAAIGGLALEGLIRSGDANAFNSYLLVAIAAVALGGTSLSGGSGGLLLSAIGATSIFLINNLLDGLAVSAQYTQVAYGGVLAVALLVNGIGSQRRRRG